MLIQSLNAILFYSSLLLPKSSTGYEYQKPTKIVRKGPFPDWWPEFLTPHRRIDCFGHKEFCVVTSDCCFPLACSHYNLIGRERVGNSTYCVYPVEDFFIFTSEWLLINFVTRATTRYLLKKVNEFKKSLNAEEDESEKKKTKKTKSKSVD